MAIVCNFGNQQMALGTSKRSESPAEGIHSASRSSPSLILRGLVAQLSHLPKSETECDVTPPGDAEPRRSVDDDNAEKWAANR